MKKYICEVCGWVYDEESCKETGFRLWSLKTCPTISSVPYAESEKNCFPK